MSIVESAPVSLVSKKQQRQVNLALREVFETSNQKESRVPLKEGPRPSGDYAPGEKRPFERRSGTGRQAFGQIAKKGGHGKGNVGRIEDEEEELEEEFDEPTRQRRVPVSEIVTLDKYTKENGVSFGLAQLEKRR